MNLIAAKVMLFLVLDAKGIILQLSVPPGQTVHGHYDAAVFRRDFRNAIR
jgi:hypothetical protein